LPRYGNYDQDGACFDCGSTVHGKKREQHDNFHANYIHRSQVKDGLNVSAVKWCDVGNHAFKANQPGAQSLDVTERDNDGHENRVVMDICAEHAFSTGPRPDKMREVEQAYEQQQYQGSAPVNVVRPYLPTYEEAETKYERP
jgi:hypothetical protein